MVKPVFLRRRGAMNFERELDQEDVIAARHLADSLPSDEVYALLEKAIDRHRGVKIITAIIVALPLLIFFAAASALLPLAVSHPLLLTLITLAFLFTPFLGLVYGRKSRVRILTVLLAIRYQDEARQAASTTSP